MLAAAPALRSTIPRITVDAEVGRQSGGVFSRIRSRLASGHLGDLVVIHTGTNGVIVPSQLGSLLAALADRTRVVLVTDHADRSWVAANNRILRTAAATHSSNVRLADWAAYSRSHPGWFWGDGIHPDPDGAHQYALLIKKSLDS
jgi:hypothetical protein